MPDRFVLIGYSDKNKTNEPTIEKLGALIPSPLIMGWDPSAGERRRQGRVELMILIVLGSLGDVEWMVNFNRAVELGMGL